jgi:hypothetical protein
MENFLLPNEIVLNIFSYLGLGDLIQCAKASKRFNTICKDKSLSYRSSMLIVKGLTVKDQKFINDILIARPYMKKVTIWTISWEEVIEKRLSENLITMTFQGPMSYRMKKKTEVLEAMGAIPRVMYTRHGHEIYYNQIDLGLFYYMPI